MTKTLLAAAASVAFTSSASAVEIPKLISQTLVSETNNKFCISPVEENGKEGTRYKAAQYSDSGPNSFKINRDGFQAEDGSICLATKVGKPKPIGSYSLRWTITFNCEDDDDNGKTHPVTLDFETWKARELTIWSEQK
jgi:hypothetical protein